jgi:hypothetical protein
LEAISGSDEVSFIEQVLESSERVGGEKCREDVRCKQADKAQGQLYAQETSCEALEKLEENERERKSRE